MPQWYKARSGVRTRAQSGAARVARFRPAFFFCSPLMSDSNKSTDELAGSEQPFVQHLDGAARPPALWHGRSRYLHGPAGDLARPSGLIDLIAVPIRAHMPPDAKLIACRCLLAVLHSTQGAGDDGSSAVVACRGGCTRYGPSWHPGLYSHEKRFAVPLIILGSLLAYVGIAFVQFFVLGQDVWLHPAVHAQECGRHA